MVHMNRLRNQDTTSLRAFLGKVLKVKVKSVFWKRTDISNHKSLLLNRPVNLIKSFCQVLDSVLQREMLSYFWNVVNFRNKPHIYKFVLKYCKRNCTYNVLYIFYKWFKIFLQCSFFRNNINFSATYCGVTCENSIHNKIQNMNEVKTTYLKYQT